MASLGSEKQKLLIKKFGLNAKLNGSALNKQSN